MNKRRILVSAYGCEPGKGSEQGVGWNWVLQLATSAELVVITRSNNRTSIERGLPSSLKSRVHFQYFDLPPSVAKYKKKERGLYAYYTLWQWGCYRHARKLIADSHFDFVMALTFGSIWMPTFMHLLPNRFIWGPLGGGEAVPYELIKSLPWRTRITQYFRYILIFSIKINPIVMPPLRRAALILVRTADTERIVPSPYDSIVRLILETAVSDEIFESTLVESAQSTSAVINVIYTGRLIPIKNVSVAIRAIAKAKSQGYEFRFKVIGDGPERKKLENLAKNLQVNDCVSFSGVVSQKEVLSQLKLADVYLFPSLKEGGAWSLMEAMTVGLPVVCLNTSGMSVIACKDSSIFVEPAPYTEVVEEFTNALIALAESPRLRYDLGINARARIDSSFRWNNIGEFMSSVLTELEP